MLNICFVVTYDISLEYGMWGGATRVLELLKKLHTIRENTNLILVSPKKIDLNGIISYSYLSHRTYDLLQDFHHITIIEDYNVFRLSKLIQIVKKYDVSIVQSESVWGSLMLSSVFKVLDVPLVTDAHNCEAEIVRVVKRSWGIQIYTRWLESRVLRASEHILAVSPRDRQLISDTYSIPAQKISVIPNGVDTSKFKYVDVKTQNLLKQQLGLNDKIVFIFHGRLDHPPNRQAVKYILRVILPEMKQTIPNAFFLIVGMRPPAVSYDPDYLAFTGAVPNLADYISLADIAVVPIVTGSGTRLKILEYLACGKPIVATRKAVEGINVINERHALLTDSVDRKFVDNLKMMCEDGHLRKKLSENSRKLAEEYDWKVIASRLYNVYVNIVG